MYNQNWTINREKAAEILRDPDATAIALFIIAIKTVGEENLLFTNEDTGYVDHMDPVELFTELEDFFRVTLPEQNENRLNALLTAFTTDLFFEDPIAFSSICLAIHSGDLAELVNGIMEEPNIEEILISRMEVELVIEKQDFTKSVQKLILSSIRDLAEDDDIIEPRETLNDIVEEHRAKIINELRSLGLHENMLEFVKQYEITI